MKIISSIISLILSVACIFSVALYPIDGNNTFNKPAMWFAVVIALVIYVITVITTRYLKIYGILTLYQVITALISFMASICGIFLTSGFLHLYTIVLGIAALINLGFYFYTIKIKN